MSRFGFALTLLLAAAGGAGATSPDPKSLAVPPAELAKARELVNRLGSEVFDDREEAQDDLEKMGRLAVAALRDGLTASPSAEVRFRCQGLLPKAEAADLQARLDTFLADADGKFEHDLAGWNEFRKVAGATAAARGVFVELLADPENRALLLAAGGPRADLGNRVAERKFEMYLWKYPRTPGAVRKDVTLADATALLFAEALVPSKLVPRTTSIPATALFQAPGLKAALPGATEKDRVYRAVAVHWLETRDDPPAMNLAIAQAEALGLPKEAAGVAARLINQPGAAPSYRAMAAMSLARHVAAEHLPALEAALGDETVLRTIRVAANGKAETVECQVRDVALAAALLVTGQKPAEYGFSAGGTAGARISYLNWQMPAGQRAAAHAKWKAWRADHPDFGKPKPR